MPWKHTCPLLTHKQLTHRVRPESEALQAPGSRKWAQKAEKPAEKPDGCLNFLLQLAADVEFKSFGSLLQALLRMVKPSVAGRCLDLLRTPLKFFFPYLFMLQEVFKCLQRL